MKNIVSLFLLLLICRGLNAGPIEQGVLFTGNNRGLLLSCACETPAGGLPRIAALRDSLGMAPLLAAGGNQFFARMPKAGDDQILAQKQARLQAQIMKDLHYDVINIGEYDLCYGLRFLQSLEEDLSLPFISVNLRDTEGNLAFPPYRIVVRNGLRIAFTGICSRSDGFNFKVADPFLALQELMREDLHHKADFVILLADAPLSGLKPFLDMYPGIDFAVFARELYATPFTRPAESGSFAHLGFQGQFTGHLQLVFRDPDANWTDLTLQYQNWRSAESFLNASSQETTVLQRQYRRVRDKAKSAFRADSKKNPNSYYWNLISMTAEIPERPDILEMIQKFGMEEKK